MIVCSVLLSGCTGMQKPVKEAKVDFSQFAGRWEGEYESTATGRSGNVYLDLTSTADNAKGGIIMHPHPKESQSPGKITYAESKKQKAIPLSIDFVEAEEGKIRGVVKPYHDPHFNSTMFTTFEGILEGSMMKGTFTVNIGNTGNSYTGTWWGTKK
jgi:hypothetical protein